MWSRSSVAGAAGAAVLVAGLVGLAAVAPAGGASPAGVDLETLRVSSRWSWPLATVRAVEPYAAPPSPYAAGHRGVDLAARPGTTVTAPSDATVHFVGVVVDRPVLTLDHGAGVLSSYEPVAAEGLAVGDTVTRGMVMGVVGEGAHCSGTCLHVGVRIDGEYVSPLLFFERPPRSVLLPLRPGAASAPRGRPGEASASRGRPGEASASRGRPGEASASRGPGVADSPDRASARGRPVRRGGGRCGRSP
ncbi:peptidoglycan DD-metalloendopeptidase family protein [Leifsonia sp. EB34]|uniref:M23 family metallopeptidase n=1 Tax=Leifsonia sp. EB34 TaxID=3156303 RepID=UPI003519AE6E